MTVVEVPVWKVSSTKKVIRIGWTPPPGQLGYILLRDGSEMIDGKRRFGLNPIGGPPTAETNIGIPQDGKSHTYGVLVLVGGGSGYVAMSSDATVQTKP
jgi:hypothetical protein